ncbi:MAG: hypothetical protein KDB63_15485 [Nocardioidaceae bacterium]|nr:hypothetical protein [Nocardioidaceae bacterium]
MTQPPAAGLPDTVLAFTRGDAAAATRLTRALIAIRDHLGNEVLSVRIDAVLHGRGTLRELVRDPVMVAEMSRGMDRFAEQWFAMSPSERADLARQGQEEEARLRAAEGLPPDPDPAPIGEFGPALTRPPAPEDPAGQG